MTSIPTRELTSQQAADMLNVSREYVVRLLDDGRLPFGTVGEQRRIKLKDVEQFKEMRDNARREGLRELSQLTQELEADELPDR